MECSSVPFFCSFSVDALSLQAAAIGRVNIVSEIGRDAVPELISKYCVEQEWISDLYKTDPDRYRQWVQHEQLDFVLDDVLASTSLRECFRDFAANEYKAAQTSPTLAIDLLLEIRTYDSTDRSDERLRGACRIWRDFIKVDARRVPGGADLGLSALLRASVQVAVGADTNDVCSATSAEPGLFKYVAQAVRMALDGAEVPEAFLASAAYHRCLSSERVQRDISSFPRIQRAYCSDERLAYTTGSAERRADTERAIRAGWIRQCAKDPSFAPEEILVARGAQ
jgi:hypothetical protein